MPGLAKFAAACALPFPWFLRRRILRTMCGFHLDKTAFISRFAFIVPAHLEMGPHAFIGPFTVCKGLELLRLDEHAIVGPLNWITAFPAGTTSPHFTLDPERKPRLLVARHAAVTSRHLIDCTDEVEIGPFTTFAGYRSQILTHSIDLKQSRQRCKPVRIGHHCFVGTGSVLLGGSVLPDCSVLGAHSLLIDCYQTPGYLYGGVPAKPIRAVDPEAQYFSRSTGFVL
jgi:acetyltransferase-like isoleucine patch superfamily enzyme